jgi:hypothetical protein
MSEPKIDIKLMRIADLQPTDYNLYSEVLDSIYRGIYRPSGFPEIWQSEEDPELFLIADGHHRIYNSFQKGLDAVRVNFHCLENAFLSKASYSYIVEEIRKKADACREAGFFHISQLIVQ